MKALLRWIGLVAFAVLALQLFFVLRIAAMAAVNPESTTFQRSEAWAQIASGGRCAGASSGCLMRRSAATSSAP
jgi:monofunctional biosynthetic peptidoglycan transglycosylase